MGIDHFSGIPVDITPLEMTRTWEGFTSATNGPGRFADPNVAYKLYNNALWALEELEKLGISMRWDDGEYYWLPTGRVPGRGRTTLRVHWQNVKPKLAKAVREKGVNVLQWTTVVDLLTNNGAVVGATAVNSRTSEFIVIKAKATVIATGEFTRCYDPETPLPWKYKFRYHWCPATCSGDGWAVAYRAGAELVNMDLTGFLFRIRDDLNISFGNLPINDGLPMRTFTWKGDELSNPNASRYYEMEQQGLTPLYDSIEHLPDDYQKRIEVAYVDERLISFKIAEERGFNPRTHRYELMANKPHNFAHASGIRIDEDLKTSVKGLYAVGDCTSGFHGCNAATVSSLLVGNSIHTFVKEAQEPVVDEAQAEGQKLTALAPLAVKDGTEPMELECAIRYICERYAGHIRAEGKLREGLRRLGSLRRVFLPKLMAKTPHYLTRCIEVRNILDLAEVHMNACQERKETRGSFFRPDYPELDPSRTNMVTYQRMENGKPILEIREVPVLKPEYAKEEK